MGRTRTRGWGRRLGRALVAVAAVGFACLAYTWASLPDVRALRTGPPASTAFMRLRAAAQRRTAKPTPQVQRWVPYSRISPALVRAVLTAEDTAFWQHDGVDYAELRLALEMNWQRGTLLSGRGGSTITQQLAKNLYLSPSRNPYRKVTELLITRRLEAELSKTRILELYLNLVEWGDGIWGAEAAAQRYFGTSAASLSASQAALLAGALINPRLYSPARPGRRLLRRQAIILSRMGRLDLLPGTGGAPPPAVRNVPELSTDLPEEPDEPAPDSPSTEASPPAPQGEPDR